MIGTTFDLRDVSQKSKHLLGNQEGMVITQSIETIRSEDLVFDKPYQTLNTVQRLNGSWYFAHDYYHKQNAQDIVRPTRKGALKGKTLAKSRVERVIVGVSDSLMPMMMGTSR